MTVTRGMLGEPARRGGALAGPGPGRLASVFPRQPRTRPGERASSGWHDSPPTVRADRPARAGLRSGAGSPLAGSLPVRLGLVHVVGLPAARREVAV